MDVLITILCKRLLNSFMYHIKNLLFFGIIFRKSSRAKHTMNVINKYYSGFQNNWTRYSPLRPSHIWTNHGSRRFALCVELLYRHVRTSAILVYHNARFSPIKLYG